MKIQIEPMKVWQALALLCATSDGERFPINVEKFEKRAKSILREIGMKNKEINAPYPDRCIPELFELAEDQETLSIKAREAAKCVMQRN